MEAEGEDELVGDRIMESINSEKAKVGHAVSSTQGRTQDPLD